MRRGASTPTLAVAYLKRGKVSGRRDADHAVGRLDGLRRGSSTVQPPATFGPAGRDDHLFLPRPAPAGAARERSLSPPFGGQRLRYVNGQLDAAQPQLRRHRGHEAPDRRRPVGVELRLQPIRESAEEDPSCPARASATWSSTSTTRGSTAPAEASRSGSTSRRFAGTRSWSRSTRHRSRCSGSRPRLHGKCWRR